MRLGVLGQRIVAVYKNVERPLFLLLLDVLAFYTALIFDYVVSSSSPSSLPDQLQTLVTRTIPLFAFVVPLFAYQDLYTKRIPFWEEMGRIIKTLFFIMIIVFVILAAQGPAGRWTVFFSVAQFIVLAMAFLTLFRFFGKRLMFRFGIGREKVIIVGAGDAGVAALRGLEADRQLGYDVVGFLDDREELKDRVVAGKKVFGPIRHLSKFLRMVRIETVVIAMPSLPVGRVSEIAGDIQKCTKRIMLIPELEGIALLNTELHHFMMLQLFLLDITNNLRSPFNRFLKQVFDAIFALLMLPVLLPFVAVIGLLIKLDSPGPVFYSHGRVGRDSRPIKIFKFRTMYVDAAERLERILDSDPGAREEWEKYFKLKNDPRVTWIGRFLRKTSLDEVPQIFNVLRGELSIVGPRPVLEEEIVKYYGGDAEYYAMVKPGITGLWQVSGRSDADYPLRVKLDSWYVANWSLWLDMVILFKTVKVVLRAEGAY